MSEAPPRSIFEGQALHWGAHLVCGAGAWLALHRYPSDPITDAWIALALVIPFLHQSWVWLCWRLELDHKALSRRLGMERGFRIYAVGFVLLAFTRIGSVWGVAIVDAGSIELAPWVGWVAGAAATVPVVVLMHSVKTYFGFRRAFGIDHFDESYRGAPLVKRGVFRFFQNAMYTLAPFILLMPAGFYLSERALVLTLFNWIVLWAHYFGTERPDMRRIYGPS